MTAKTTRRRPGARLTAVVMMTAIGAATAPHAVAEGSRKPAARAQVAGVQAGTLVAQAGSVQRSFDIPAQSLTDALPLFGRQAGAQVSVHGEVVRGVATRGVRGTMTTEAALQRLLAGTGVTYRVTPEGTVILEPQLATGATGATVLPPIVVERTLGSGAATGGPDGVTTLRVTAADLERRNPATVKDIFAGEAQVSVGGAIRAAQKVYVNGIEETNLAVTVDGSRQNNKVFHHNGTNLIDPSLLKAARVDPGVAPADAGPGALGGSIAYETVDASDLLAPGRSVGGFATTSFNTNGNVFTNSAALYGRASGFEGLGFVSKGQGNDYKDGSGFRVPGTETDFRSFLGKVAYTTPDGHRFEISGQELRDDADRPFRANIGNVLNRPDPVVRQYDLTSKNYVFNYTRPDATGLWDPNILLAYSESKIGVPVPYGSLGRTGGWSGKAENAFHFGSDNSVTAGVDFYDDVSRYEDPTYAAEESATNTGVYAQARLRPFAPLRLSFGLRGDRQTFTGVNGAEFDNSGISGNVSAAYDVTETVTAKAGYSNVWGGVARAENYILNPAWTYGSGIPPVQAESVTLGVDFNHRGFTAGAGVFQSDFDNARDEIYRVATIVADFRARGYHLSAGYDWGAGFVRATYIDSKITVNGVPGDSDLTQYLGAPLGRVFALEATQRFDDLGLTLGGSLDAALQGSSYPAYEVVSLFGEHRPAWASFLTLRLDARNIFDERYADRATYGQEFGNVRPLREPGRSVIVSAKAKF